MRGILLVPTIWRESWISVYRSSTYVQARLRLRVSQSRKRYPLDTGLSRPQRHQAYNQILPNQLKEIRESLVLTESLFQPHSIFNEVEPYRFTELVRLNQIKPAVKPLTLGNECLGGIEAFRQFFLRYASIQPLFFEQGNGDFVPLGMNAFVHRLTFVVDSSPKGYSPT